MPRHYRVPADKTSVRKRRLRTGARADPEDVVAALLPGMARTPSRLPPRFGAEKSQQAQHEIARAVFMGGTGEERSTPIRLTSTRKKKKK